MKEQEHQMNDTSVQSPTSPRYPDCHVTLLGTSTHAVSIMMKVRRALGRYLCDAGLPSMEADAVVQEFVQEAMAGDADNPDHVLTTAFRWVDVN